MVCVTKVVATNNMGASMKKKRTNKDQIYCGILFPAGMMVAIKTLADANDRSLSAQIRTMIKYALEHDCITGEPSK